MTDESHTIDLSKPFSIISVERIGYIDIAKGIGIVLVVMGHNDFSFISPFAYKLIYSFHMPMFFFMSGMFFKPDIPFWAFARRRFDRVLRPFLFTLLLIYFMSISFSKVSILVATRRLFKALYGNAHYLDWVQLWFLPHLFIVSLFAYIFIQAIRRTHLLHLRWIILAVLYIAGVLGIALFWPFDFTLIGKDFIIYGLPFSLDIVFVSSFFFILGYELYKKLDILLFGKTWGLLIAAIPLIFLVWYFPSRIDFNTRLFESLVINTLEALLGIALIIVVSKQIEKSGVLSALFKYIGQASLVILIFQVPIQEYWGQKILALTNNLPFSYWMSFIAGVLGPIVIHTLFIRPNPIMRKWFSQPAPQESSQTTVSVYE